MIPPWLEGWLWWAQIVGAVLGYVVGPLLVVAVKNRKDLNRMQNGALEKRFTEERHTIRHDINNLLNDAFRARDLELKNMNERVMFIERHIMSGGQHH